MQMIKMNHTDLTVSRVIAGCMYLGGGAGRDKAFLPEHVKEARVYAETALNLGINYFDHANTYASGRAESAFGELFKETPSLRDKMVLQSKVGICLANHPEGAIQHFNFSHKHIIFAVEESLRRLNTSHLDILLLHRPDPLMEGEEIAKAFGELKAQGKVRYFGVSNQNRFVMEYVQSFLPDPLVANQMELSILQSGLMESVISCNQRPPNYPNGVEGLVEYCRLKGMNLQAWRVLSNGVLSGKTLENPAPNVAETAALVKTLAEKYQTSLEAIVLAWILKHPAKISPVIGTINPKRVALCAQSTDIELSREDWYALFASGRGKSMP